MVFSFPRCRWYCKNITRTEAEQLLRQEVSTCHFTCCSRAVYMHMQTCSSPGQEWYSPLYICFKRSETIYWLNRLTEKYSAYMTDFHLLNEMNLCYFSYVKCEAIISARFGAVRQKEHENIILDPHFMHSANNHPSIHCLPLILSRVAVAASSVRSSRRFST